MSKNKSLENQVGQVPMQPAHGRFNPKQHEDVRFTPSFFDLRQMEQEVARISLKAAEYDRLLTLVAVVASHDPVDASIHITISKHHQVLGKDWKEILEMATAPMEKKQNG